MDSHSLIAANRFTAIHQRDEGIASGEGGVIILSPAFQLEGGTATSESEELRPDLIRQEAAADRCGPSLLLAGRISPSQDFTSNVMDTAIGGVGHYRLPPATLISNSSRTKVEFDLRCTYLQLRLMKIHLPSY